MYLLRAAQEFGFALLERYGVHDGLALCDLQPGHEHLPFRRVDHRRHAGYLGFRRHQVEERAHGLRTVDQPVVHADVDDLCPGVDLGAGDGERLLVVAFADQPREFGRACDVGAFADVHEIGFGDDAQRFEAAQRRDMFGCRHGARGVVPCDLRQLEDMCRRGAAASADDVYQPAAHVFADVAGEHLGCFVVAAHDIGEPGVGVCRDAEFGHRGQPFEVGHQLSGAIGAVEADGEEPRMRYRGVESLDGLSREGAAAGVGQRARDHDGDCASELCGQRVDGVEGGLGVERVENGFDQQDIRAAVHEAARLVGVGFGQLCEGHLAGCGVPDVGRHRGRAVGRAHRARHETGFERVAGREFVGCAACHPGRRTRNLIGVCLQPVVGQRHGVGVERVGLDDVGARLQVFYVYFAHRPGACHRQQVVAAFEQYVPVAEPFAAVILLRESVLLHHGAEAAVEQQDAGFERLV